MSGPPPLRKYPRTPHLEGSRLQPGDEDLAALPFAELAGRPLVVHEKLDGANAGLRFDARGELWLQSRGHYLRGGAVERQFDLFKQWAYTRRAALWERLGARYQVYGEWLYAKHTIFYDHLPHFFCAFDVLDLEAGRWLTTAARRELLAGLPLAEAPLLAEARSYRRLEDLLGELGRARFKGPTWREALLATAAERGQDPERVWSQTDSSQLGEGLVIRLEDDDAVIRAKYVRAGFRQAVVDSGSHWADRPLLPNALAPEAPALP